MPKRTRRGSEPEPPGRPSRTGWTGYRFLAGLGFATVIGFHYAMWVSRSFKFLDQPVRYAILAAGLLVILAATLYLVLRFGRAPVQPPASGDDPDARAARDETVPTEMDNISRR